MASVTEENLSYNFRTFCAEFILETSAVCNNLNIQTFGFLTPERRHGAFWPICIFVLVFLYLLIKIRRIKFLAFAIITHILFHADFPSRSFLIFDAMNSYALKSGWAILTLNFSAEYKKFSDMSFDGYMCTCPWKLRLIGYYGPWHFSSWKKFLLYLSCSYSVYIAFRVWVYY